MEKYKVWHYMPTIKMYREMVLKECTFFHKDPRTRFTITSRHIEKAIPGLWLNHWRCLPYEYRWSPEEEKILPEHYKQRCREFMKGEPEPVHWRPDPRKYYYDKMSGEKFPVINAPVPVVYPKECNEGLWGGEGIVFGYYTMPTTKRLELQKTPTLPKIWMPQLQKRVLYSEILDRYISVTITQRSLYLIDEAFGLDNYILKTHEVDLCSRLAVTLKREMLVALANKSMYPNDAYKREKICKRYEKFAIPAEEAEWVGLKVSEAVEKAKKIHEEQNPPVPLKNLYLLKLVNKLKMKAAAS